jgi:CheY-like chemotaxis protein
MTELALSGSEVGVVAQRTILIVDDEPAVRTLLREIADGLSIACQVYEAADGQSALQIARSRQPDLVLLDIVLPGASTSGVLVCQELCKDSRTKVVIVSGNASKSILRTCLSMGAAGWVPKPFVPADLRSKLMTWLAD